MYAPTEFPVEGKFPVLAFRKEFHIKSSIERARIRITAKGLYALYINGKKATDTYLNPGWCDYRKELYYQEYDVTPLVQKGDNVIVIELAAGWYYGTMGLLNKQAYGSRGAVLYRMKVSLKNGDEKVYESDSFHKVGKTKIVSADILDGEIWDGSVSDGYRFVGFDDSAWEKSEVETCNLVPQKQKFEPIRCVEYLYPKLVSEENGVRIYDFGRNFAGNIEAKFRADKGARVIFRFAEILDSNGKIYTRNLRRAKATDTYISGGEPAVFAPEYVYHGFRFVEVRVQDGEFDNFTMRGKVLTTDFARGVSVNTSNPLLNDLVTAIDNTMKSNFLAVPTDCPQRDERLGWLGDICVFGGSAMYLADCGNYMRKYLGDIRNAQFEDGSVYNVAPFIPEVAGVGDNGWGDAIVFLTYDHYCRYGETEVVEENLFAMKKWVDYLVGTSSNYLREGASGAPADWLALCFTEKKLVNTAYSYYSALLLSEMCYLLDDAETKKYEEISEKYKEAFQKEYLRGNELTVQTQGAYALAVAFGLVDAEILKESFEKVLQKDNYMITTGFLSTRYLLPALCDIGRTDLAYKMLLNSEYPSWFYMLLSGGTTVWERWNGITTFYGSKVLEDYSMNSFCHCALGSIIEWIVQYMFGLQLVMGGEGLYLHPYFDPLARIKTNQCVLQTKKGEISVRYTYQNEVVRYEIKLPPDLKLDVVSSDVLEVVKNPEENGCVIYYSLHSKSKA